MNGPSVYGNPQDSLGLWLLGIVMLVLLCGVVLWLHVLTLRELRLLEGKVHQLRWEFESHQRTQHR